MNELALASFAAANDSHLVGEPRSARFASFKAGFDARAELERLTRLGFRFLARSDPGFPPLLRAIHDPPPGLFVRGEEEIALLARPAVAIVGARACSAYGRQIARSLGRELAAAGLVVVSGLARGVDSEAHRGALEASGTTVAVLGCGIDRDYPAANRELARQVAATGLVVSEYAPGVEPAPWRFPARNRIVAGLCAATVVVEARERSGALITADFALEEGREVFAVPGEITSALSGRLERAAPARRDAAHVRAGCPGELRTCGARSRAAPELGPAAAAVLERVREGAAGADELARATGLGAGELAAVADRARARREGQPGGGRVSSVPLASLRGRLVLARGARPDPALPAAVGASGRRDRRWRHHRHLRGTHASAPRARRLVLRRRARRASARIARAAFLPGPPVTPPPGCVPAPHM